MSRRTLSVLAIDSYPDVAESTAQLLAACGHACTVATGCAEALDRIPGVRPDVVILDVPLHDGDGFQLFDALCSLLKYRPLWVVVTAWPNLEADARLAGCDHFLVKPVAPAGLVGLLDRYAAGSPPASG